MQIMKVHNFRVTLQIHEIAVAVKFPCSVILAVEQNAGSRGSGTEQCQSTQLVNNRAIVNQQIMTDLHLNYDCKKSKYGQAKIVILVYLKSISGKIPAGSATLFIASEKPKNMHTVRIEKCPDKQAQLVYSLKMAYLSQRQIHRQPGHILGSFAQKDPQIQLGNLGERKMHRQSGRLGGREMHRQSTDLVSSKSMGVLKQPWFQASERKKLLTELEQSKASHIVSSRVLSEQLMLQSEHSFISNQSRISKIITREHEQQIQSQKQKIDQLRGQRNQAWRQIRSLKAQLQERNNDKSMQNVGSPLRSEKSERSRARQLEHQLEELKRNSSLSLQESRLRVQELENQVSITVSKYQKLDIQNSKNLNQYQMTSERLQLVSQSLREAEQKLAEKDVECDKITKQCEIKESAYQQQLNALALKLEHSEKERQKLLYQKKDKPHQLKSNNSKQLQFIRDKEKQLMDQRNQFNNKIRKLEREKEELKRQNQQKQVQVQTLAQQISNGQINCQQLELDTETAEFKLQECIAQIEKSKKQFDEMQGKLMKQVSVLKQQNKLCCSHLLDKQQLLEAANAKIKKLQCQLQVRLEEKEGVIGEIKMLNNNLSKETKKLAKKVEVYQKSEKEKVSKIEEIKRNQEKHAKLEASKSKDLEDRAKFVESTFKSQIDNFVLRLQQLEEQKSEDVDRITELEKQLSAKSIRIKQLEENLSQSTSSHNEIINNFKSMSAMQEHELMHKISKLEAENKHLVALQVQAQATENSKISELDKKLKDTVRSIQQEHAKQLSAMEEQIKDLRKEIENKSKQVVAQNDREGKLGIKIEQLVSEIHTKCKEIQILKIHNKTVNDDGLRSKTQIKQVQSQLETLRQQHRLVSQQLKDKQQKYIELTKNCNELKKGHEKYCKANALKIKQFCNLYKKASEGKQTEISAQILHEQEQIRKVLGEILNIAQSTHLEHLQTTFSHQKLQQQIKQQLRELDDTKQNLEQTNNRTQVQLKQLKIKYKQLQKQFQEYVENATKNLQTEKQREWQLQHRINQLHSQLKTAQESLRRMESQLTAKNAEEQTLRQQLNILKQQAVKQSQQIVQLQEKLEIKQKQIRQSEQQYERTMKSLSNETEKNVGRLRDLVKDEYAHTIDKLQQENYQLLSQAKNLREELGSISKLMSQNQARLELERQRNTQILQEMEEHKQCADQLRNQQTPMHYIRIHGFDDTDGSEHKFQNLTCQNSLTESENKQLRNALQKLQKQHNLLAQMYETQKCQKGLLQDKTQTTGQRLYELDTAKREIEKQHDHTFRNVKVMQMDWQASRERLIRENQSLRKQLRSQMGKSQTIIQDSEGKFEEIIAERNFLAASSDNLQRQLDEHIEVHSKQIMQLKNQVTALSKEKEVLEQQLLIAQQKVKGLHVNLNELSRSFEIFQVSNCNQANYMGPILNKINNLLERTRNYQLFMGQFEASRHQLLRGIGCHEKNVRPGSRMTDDAIREFNVSSNRCKMQILKQFSWDKEDKLIVVEEFRKLQHAVEKLRCV